MFTASPAVLNRGAEMAGRRRADFWTRRRAAVRDAESATPADSANPAAAEAAVPPGSAPDKTDAEILRALDLPDPDTLQEDADFTPFLRDAVPQHLRRRALRRLWRVHPALANLDGLVDYGEDFSDAATVIENLQTAYQVGKGMLRHVLAAAEEPRENGEEGGGFPAGEGASAPSELASLTGPSAHDYNYRLFLKEAEPPGVEEQTAGGGPATEEPKQDLAPKRVKRMRFTSP